MDTRFADTFKGFLKSQKLSGMGAAYQSGLKVSVASVNNWKRGYVPTDLEKFREFLVTLNAPSDVIAELLALAKDVEDYKSAA